MAPPQGADTVQSNGATPTAAPRHAAKLGFTPKNEIPSPKIVPNVLHQIGKTPMIRLNRIPQSLGVECEVCKLNFHKEGFTNYKFALL